NKHIQYIPQPAIRADGCVGVGETLDPKLGRTFVSVLKTIFPFEANISTCGQIRATFLLLDESQGRQSRVSANIGRR
ncbi:hypothetical protein, partial [Pelagimonas sp. KU-00592-HH]|uniref:hypothetical protein n=1 Tax=Pelagimonas sp. KU-00592-HH TaxID=3127651 RepID=UPI00333E6EAE